MHRIILRWIKLNEIKKITQNNRGYFCSFFLLTSITGIILLWRKDDIYDKEMKNLFIGLHNWEIGAKYIGAILALGLIFMTLTGLYMAYKTYRK
jgi:hypothetical protein